MSGFDLLSLAIASDANSTADEARKIADENRHNSQPTSAMVVIKPVKLINDPKDLPPEEAGFFKRLSYSPRQILSSKPYITFSVSRHHIENLVESEDGAGNKYVTIKISKYAKVQDPDHEDYWLTEAIVPGSIEQVAKRLSE